MVYSNIVVRQLCFPLFGETEYPLTSILSPPMPAKSLGTLAMIYAIDEL